MSWLGLACALVGLFLLVLGIICWVHPYVNVPIMSQVVCAFKGGTWYPGGMFAVAGCYPPP